MILQQDWWNSTSYADYYRTWNVVVHDWLYAYIYKDVLMVSSVSSYNVTVIRQSWSCIGQHSAHVQALKPQRGSINITWCLETFEFYGRVQSRIVNQRKTLHWINLVLDVSQVFLSQALVLFCFHELFIFFFRKFCVRWVTPVVSFKKLRGKFERGQLHVRRFTAVDIRDLKQSGRQRQGRLRLKNKFLPLMRILKMAACVYRLIRRHTSTSA